MDKQAVINIHSTISLLLMQNNLFEAINQLKTIILANSIHGIEKLDTVTENYRYMLQYVIKGTPDPQRNQVLNKIKHDLFEIIDMVKIQLDKKNSTIPEFKLLQLNGLLETFDNSLPGNMHDIGFYVSENNMNSLFFETAINAKFTTWQYELILNVLQHPETSWYKKSVILSALTLSIINNFDIKKLEILYTIYQSDTEQLWQRALVGLLFSFYIYDNRLHLYPEITKMLTELKSDEKAAKRIEAISLQMVKTLDTDKVSKMVETEIMPQMAKFTPDIKEKLNLDSVARENAFDDENPMWENFFKDSPGLLNKLTEMSEMQLDGVDVFISTFSQLKHFGFFNKISNWFVPFYSKNPDLYNSLSNVSDQINPDSFFNSLEKAPFICNSDKYSFCFSMSHLPESQKEMMAHYFNAEVNQMNEIVQDDEILKKPTVSYKIITQYIQDLYRFFKFHPLRNHFHNVFNTNWNLVNTNMYNQLVSDTLITRKIGEYFFSRGYFQQAIDVFSQLHGSNATFELYQKTGYAAQKLKNYGLALENYLKADIFEANEQWTIKKIAFCYRKTNNFAKALEYYNKAEQADPDNLTITAAIGQCYMDMENFEQALKYYYKVEFLAPENKKVLRPIAWCNFELKKHDYALKYCLQTIDNEAIPHDYILAGYLHWISNNRNSALDWFTKPVIENIYTINELINDIVSAKSILLKYDISELDLYQLIDVIRFRVSNLL